MIRKKITPQSDTPLATPPQPVRKRNYVEIPLPKFSYNRTSYTPILIVSLFICSFLLGMLATKISYLENGGTLISGAQKPADTAPIGAVPSAAPKKVTVKEGHLPILGDKNAKVTIVEFSDFQCPFCKQFVDQTWQQIKTEYIDTGKVKLAFRHFPLSSIHPNAQKASEATECANEQDKFWEFHDKLFATQDTWSSKAATEAVTDFSSSAGELGLNVEQFTSCLNEGKYAKAVTDDTADGSAAGVTGTPAFVINGELLVGAQPFSEFKAKIDPLLK